MGLWISWFFFSGSDEWLASTILFGSPLPVRHLFAPRQLHFAGFCTRKGTWPDITVRYVGTHHNAGGRYPGAERSIFSSAKWNIQPPSVKPPVGSSSCPPGACTIPSSDTNADAMRFLIGLFSIIKYIPFMAVGVGETAPVPVILHFRRFSKQ